MSLYLMVNEIIFNFLPDLTHLLVLPSLENVASGMPLLKEDGKRSAHMSFPILALELEVILFQNVHFPVTHKI